jgi:hypothetical protein
VELDVFHPSNTLPRRVVHVISALADAFCRKIEAVAGLKDPIPQAPIMHQDDILHPNGLWGIRRPDLHVACRSVLKCTGWVRRHLTLVEFLRLCDMPLGMDEALSGDKHIWDVLVRGISPLIVSLVFHSIWAVGSGGGRQGHEVVLQRQWASPSPTEDGARAMSVLSIKSPSPSKCRDSPGLIDNTSLEGAGPLGPPLLATIIVVQDPLSQHTSDDTTLFKKLKKEHNLAKAVKNDNAKVPVHLWDDAAWAGAPPQLIEHGEGARDPPEFFKQAMTGFRKLFVRLYRLGVARPFLMLEAFFLTLP